MRTAGGDSLCPCLPASASIWAATKTGEPCGQLGLGALEASTGLHQMPAAPLPGSARERAAFLALTPPLPQALSSDISPEIGERDENKAEDNQAAR